MLPVKYRSLLKANWWPRIIGKVNPLNLIERTTRAESKIHFHRLYDALRGRKNTRGSEKKPAIILSSSNMCARTDLCSEREREEEKRFYRPHKDLQNTPRSYFTVTIARYFVQRGMVPAIRFTKAFAIRPSSVDEIGETWNWIDPTVVAGGPAFLARGQVKVLSPSCYSSRYTL